MKKKKAVLILLYNRPEHTKKLLNSIEKSKNSKQFKYYFFCDGPKNNFDYINIIEIKKILKEFSNNFTSKIFFRKKNIGLLKNVIQSINSIFKIYEEVIILEDDLVINKNFFIFMSNSLKKYKNSNKVLQISGYSYPINSKKFHYFLPLTSCWGWGITKKNWRDFIKFFNDYNSIMTHFLTIKSSNVLKRSFNYNNSYNYFSMLDSFLKKKISSWGIIFYLYLFVNNKLSFFPFKSLVNNNGFDGSGRHKSKSDFFNEKSDTKKRGEFPKKITIRRSNNIKVEQFFRDNLTIYAKVKKKIYEKIF